MIQIRSFLTNLGYMLHQRKPKLVVRAGIGFANYMITKKPRLRYVDVIVDYGCNLKCEHCSCETLKDRSRRQLTSADWKRVARQCESLGTIIFGIQGGEPLIYPDLEDIIKSLNPHRNFISIKSNGTIAKAELFGKLKQIGVDSITIGFGPVPNDFEFEDYNLITRKLRDSFSLSLRTIEMIAEVGIKPMISVVIGKQNIRSEVFRRIIDLAKEYGSVLNCALAVPVGGWALNAEVILRKEDRDELNRIMRENPHVRTDFQSNWFIDGCGALKEKIYISPYGDVMPCPFIHISFGNVLEEPIERIWRRGWKTKTFSEYAPVCIAAEDEQFLSYLEIAQKRGKQLPIRFDDPDIQEILKTSCAQRFSRQI